MKLKELRLQNFRCIEDLEISFDDTLTVIVGKNGVGKTTILEAAAIAIGTIFYSLSGIHKYGFKKTDAHNQYFKIGSAIDVQPQYPVTVWAQGMVDQQSVQWKRALNSENGKTTVVDAKEMTDISKKYQQRIMKGDPSLVLPVIAYYGTGRLWDYHREKKRDSLKKNNRKNGYIDCLDGMANIKLMLHWFKKMAWEQAGKTTPSPEYIAVRKAMEKCFELITNIENVNIEFNPDTREIEIIYYINDQDPVKIPLSQLSDGYKGTISLIADISYRMATLNPGLGADVLAKTDGVVLIDEVDLHLHPAWQQRIIKDLRTIFPKVQFIVTTHAPAVINSVQSENLVILKDAKIDSPQNEVYGKDVKSVLNEIMDVTERPPEVADLFVKFYNRLNEKKFDDAKKILDDIDNLRGYHDPEVVTCRVKLKLERLRGGQL